MVAQNTVRTYGVNRVFRFVESIRVHQKGRQISIYLPNMCATCSELPCYTEYLKSYRKFVLHLPKYIFSVYLSKCSTDLRLILGHSVVWHYQYMYCTQLKYIIMLHTNTQILLSKKACLFIYCCFIKMNKIFWTCSIELDALRLLQKFI